MDIKDGISRQEAKMTDETTRDRMRAKQDVLIDMAERARLNLDLQLSSEWPGSPTIRELYHYVFPEYEDCIDYIIHYLSAR